MKKQTMWINIEERRPERFKPVYVLWSDGTQMVSYDMAEEGWSPNWQYASASRSSRFYVTHWAECLDLPTDFVKGERTFTKGESSPVHTINF